MRAEVDCIPCMFKQALNTARIITDDPSVHRKILAKVAEIVASHKANLRMISVMDLPQFLHKKHIIVRSDVTENVKDIVKDLKDAGFNVISVLDKTRFI